MKLASIKIIYKISERFESCFPLRQKAYYQYSLSSMFGTFVPALMGHKKETLPAEPISVSSRVATDSGTLNKKRKKLRSISAQFFRQAVNLQAGKLIVMDRVKILEKYVKNYHQTCV